MNELGPVNNDEYVFFIGFLLGSVILASIVFGNIAGLVQQISEGDISYQ